VAQRIFDIENRVPQRFGEMVARLPLPGGHERFPRGLRAGIRHHIPRANPTSSPGFVEEEKFFRGLRVQRARCPDGIALAIILGETTRC